MNIPLVFVRYAPGACGTFLITLLSSSAQAACWNPDLEKAKGDDDFAERFFDWFCQKFTADLDHHLKHEPHHPYKLDFFSAKHPRGDDISGPDFLHLLKDRDDRLLLDNIHQNKKTLLRLNKSIIPEFGYGNDTINIVIDPDSEKWLHRTRYVKLFGRDQDHYLLKEEHPEYLQAKNYNLRFNNPYLVKESHHRFVKNYVIGDRTVQTMRDRSCIIDHISNQQCRQHWVNLSQLLHIDSATDTVIGLARTLKFDLDRDLIKKCCEHYHRTNVMPMQKRTGSR